MTSVLHTIDSIHFSKGGPAYTVPELCRSLGRLGMDVGLATRASIGEPQRYELTSDGVALDGEAVLDLTSSEFAARSKVGLIHNHGIWLPINRRATRASRGFAIPLLLSPRGMLAPAAMRHRAIKKWIAWWLFQRRDTQAATVMHATDEAEAKDFRRIGMTQPIAIVPNGVNIEALTDDKTVNEKRIALFVGRIHPIKGLLNLVAAWNLIRPAGWACVIAGIDEDGHEAAVRRAVRQAALSESFRFAGPVDGDEKWRLYRNADLFVLPTLSENFGVVVAESLASEVPVITTTGAPWSCLDTERCGWWVDVGVEPLAAALKAATSCTDADRSAMGKRGRSLVARRFSWERIGGQMKEVYAWMLGGGSPPSCVMTN